MLLLVISHGDKQDLDTADRLHMRTLVSNMFAGLDLELSIDARGNVVNMHCWSLRTLQHSFNLPDKTSELTETASGSQYLINIQYLHLDPPILHLHTIETIATIISQVYIRLHTYCRLWDISIRIRRKGAHFANSRHCGTCFFVYSFTVARNLALSVLSTWGPRYERTPQINESTHYCNVWFEWVIRTRVVELLLDDG